MVIQRGHERLRRISSDEVKLLIKEILISDSPMPLAEVARRVGCKPGTIRKAYPEESAIIVARYKDHVVARKQATSLKIVTEIVNAVEILHQQGLYPSGPKVEQLMGKKHLFRNPTFRVVWREALMNLGLRYAKNA